MRLRHAARLAGGLAALTALGWVLSTATAGAQPLLQRLFGVDEAPATGGNAARVVPLPVDKNEDAAVLLVIGDFLARGVADALTEAFAQDPSVVVVDRSNGSSGIVRDDFYDWQAELPAVLAETQPTYVVLLIGTNDRQSYWTGERYQLRTPDWDRVYAERAGALAALLTPLGAQAHWVGLPPMRSRSASADVAYFNTVYEEAAEAAGISFIDIWDGFADQEGRFTLTGPAVDGQNRVLRGDDGFSFTRAGSAKVAFFVQNELGRDPLAAPAQFAATPAPAIAGPPAPAGQAAGPVLVMGEPPPGAAAVLAAAPTAAPEQTLAYRFFVRGEPLPAVPGRADDFTWPRGGAAQPLPDPVP